MEENEKKVYEKPQIRFLGSVQELTAATSPPTNGSVICSDFSSEDALCEIPDV